jgi:Glycosyl transferases group 1
MSKHRITQVEDYEPLVGRETVERIREKSSQVQRSAGGELQFDLLRRRRSRDDFLAHSAHEQPRSSDRIARDSGHGGFLLDHEKDAQCASGRRDRSLRNQEAMWKRTPVIGGNVGGIRYQIEDGVNGFLVSSIEQAADRIVKLLKDEKLRDAMGKNARATVRDKFLLTRYLEEYLDLFETFSGSRN